MNVVPAPGLRTATSIVPPRLVTRLWTIGEAEARAGAGLLRREERIEGAREDFGSHPASRVGHPRRDPGPVVGDAAA